MEGESGKLQIAHATHADIPSWMALVRLVIDGFPHLREDEHVEVLKARIEKNEALILRDGSTVVGNLLFSRHRG